MIVAICYSLRCTSKWRRRRGGEKHEEAVLSPSFIVLPPPLPRFTFISLLMAMQRIFPVSLENWVQLTGLKGEKRTYL